jgi:hypothetical protein
MQRHGSHDSNCHHDGDSSSTSGEDDMATDEVDYTPLDCLRPRLVGVGW